MTTKNPDINTRLRRHPDIVIRRSAPVLWAGAAGAVVLLICWVLLLTNAAQLSQDFASHQQSAVTVNQRIGSRFGVLIGAVALPILALLPLLLAWFFSPRYVRRATGNRLRRDYRGVFAGTSAQGAEFQQLARTRNAAIIGPMHQGVEKGNLIVEAWSAADDGVGYVGTFAFDLREDPGWELVDFSGPSYADYRQIFVREAQ